MTTAIQASRPHGILWEGYSILDNAPLVAIVTSGTSNTKTGPMSQVWLLRRDLSPQEAVRTGADVSVCGRCALRSSTGGFEGRACYVQVQQAPASVWRTYQRGRYAPVEPAAFARAAIRWGAYGDPALLPSGLVRACNGGARCWTGYTHMHRYAWAQWCKGIFMASVETEAQEAKLRVAGWGTFRVGRRDGSDVGSATPCPHQSSGATCVECKACDGSQRAIFASAHGVNALAVPAERLLRQRAG